MCERPSDFVDQGESDNGDGSTFHSRDGRVKFLCSGSNSPATTAQQEFDDRLSGFRADGDVVSYSNLKGNAITVSGTDKDGRIFYERVLWGMGSTNTILWTYPKEMADDVKKALEHSVATFKPGRLADGN